MSDVASVDGLRELLAADVHLVGDGGGKAAMGAPLRRRRERGKGAILRETTQARRPTD